MKTEQLRNWMLLQKITFLCDSPKRSLINLPADRAKLRNSSTLRDDDGERDMGKSFRCGWGESPPSTLGCGVVVLQIQQTQSNPDDKFHLRIRANNTGRFIWEAARAQNGNQNGTANIRITYTRRNFRSKFESELRVIWSLTTKIL